MYVITYLHVPCRYIITKILIEIYRTMNNVYVCVLCVIVCACVCALVCVCVYVCVHLCVCVCVYV